MPDIMSKQARSRRMSLVRSRDTAFETAFLRLLSAEIYPLGYRYRKHSRRVFGTPDLVFTKYRTAVFLDSDFWHGTNYDARTTRMNEFWRGKIERNIQRDAEVNRQLRKSGWTVIRIGESEAKKRARTAIHRIKRVLRSRSPP